METIKDHQIAKLVNDLRDVALQFSETQQLRSRIQDAVLPFITELRAALASQAESAPVVAGSPYTFPIGEDGEYQILNCDSLPVGTVLYYHDAKVIAKALAQRAASVEAQPIGEVSAQGRFTSNVDWFAGYMPPVGTKLYTSPPAQPVPAATSAPTDERAKFEAWASKKLPHDALRASDGTYYASTLELAWTVWQAAGVPHIERDAARLDFMIEKDAFIVWTLRDGSIRQCQLMNQDEDEDFHILSGVEDRYFNSPRDAIDAAMAVRQGEKG